MTYSAVRASLHGELQGRGLGLVVRSGGTRRKTHSKDGLDDKAVELLERDFVRLGEALSKLLRLGRLAPRQGDLSELESTAKLRRRQLAAHLPAQRELYRINQSSPSVAIRFFSPCSFATKDSSVADLSGAARKRAWIFWKEATSRVSKSVSSD